MFQLFWDGAAATMGDDSGFDLDDRAVLGGYVAFDVEQGGRRL
jgi:hypothetical protein